MDFKEQLRNFEGLWVSKELWFNQDLSIQEKMFLLEINSLDNSKHCHASNTYFSKFFQLSPNRCSEIINKLQKKELISIRYIRENNQIKKRVIMVLEKGNKVLGKSTEGIRDIESGYSENSEERSNNIIRSNSKKRIETEIKELNFSDDLTKTLIDFSEMRKTIKKPLTKKALNLLIAKLDKISNNEQEKIEILNNSIMNCWQGVFELKNKPNNSKIYGKGKEQEYLDSIGEW